MYRPELVDMRQHGADALRARLEAIIAQQRIEPNQPTAGTMQTVHFKAQLLDAFALQAVGEEQHHAPALEARHRVHALPRRVPQRRRVAEVDVVVERPDQLVAVARERRRRDADLVAEAADAGLIARQHAQHELLRAFLQVFHLERHAAARVEHHDHGDLLDLVHEQRGRHFHAVVVDLELIPLQIRHEPAGRIRDRRVERHRARARFERRALLRGQV